MTGHWLELANGVYARRYEELDLTTGLVVGGERCLVVDSRGDVEQGGEYAAAIREITPLPWSVVYTHAHFDHAFGTTPFLPCDVWAQERCVAELDTYGENARKRRAASYRAEGKPDIADALDRTVITNPDHLVADRTELDLGGRTAVLVHPGLAHTDHDLVVHVPDAGIVFAGDTVEHADSGYSAESFGTDTHLAAWPDALDAILALGAPAIVPGHGDPVDAEFVRRHRDGLRELVALKLALQAGETTEEAAVAASSYPADVTRAALGTP